MKKIDHIIRSTASRPLLGEVEDLLEMAVSEEWESIQTLEDAFDVISEKADNIEEWRPFRTSCRKVEIALGRYIPMSEDEILRTQVSHGTKWDFKLDGVAYKYNTASRLSS